MKTKLILALTALFAAAPAFAEEVATEVATSSNAGMYAIAAGFVLGIAALGGALGQSKVGQAAMEGIARNPQASKQMFVPMILGLALIESLVIYALVIAFALVGKF
tara:strand:+ start:463 stop:780 length:318 start_codon:yes stop_codon:yes gene_type:complete